jgi:hypothetical protein
MGVVVISAVQGVTHRINSNANSACTLDASIPFDGNNPPRASKRPQAVTPPRGVEQG